MNAVLARWNGLEAEAAAREALPCCGSWGWARELAARRPFTVVAELFAASDAVWRGLPENDWRKAFDSHPRIGETHAQRDTPTLSLRLSEGEQRAAMRADEKARRWLFEGNRRYEAKFGRIFIVCASGRTAAEILAMLEARMSNDPVTELQEAAEQQRQVTQLRLRRWLEGA